MRSPVAVFAPTAVEHDFINQCTHTIRCCLDGFRGEAFRLKAGLILTNQLHAPPAKLCNIINQLCSWQPNSQRKQLRCVITNGAQTSLGQLEPAKTRSTFCGRRYNSFVCRAGSSMWRWAGCLSGAWSRFEDGAVVHVAIPA